jgi:hypothetical protein
VFTNGDPQAAGKESRPIPEQKRACPRSPRPCTESNGSFVLGASSTLGESFRFCSAEPGPSPWVWAAGETYHGWVLDLSSVDLERIADALADQTDYEHHTLINPDTGEIAFWTSDTGIDGQTPVDLDELDLLVIDPLPSWVWYQDMAFRDTRARRRAVEWLADNSLIDDGAADHFLSGHPDPILP